MTEESSPRRRITSKTFDELTQKAGSFYLPVLIDIQHPEITWGVSGDGDKIQQDGHLRIVNDTQGLFFKGNEQVKHYYAPCTLSIKMPKEDGKKKSTATLSISCVDSRIIEVIRSVTEDLSCQVVGLYSKLTAEDGKVKYAFSNIYGKKFSMTSVSWDGINAQWTLDPDPILDLNVPRDKGSKFRLPSILEQQ